MSKNRDKKREKKFELAPNAKFDAVRNFIKKNKLYIALDKREWDEMSEGDRRDYIDELNSQAF